MSDAVLGVGIFVMLVVATWLFFPDIDLPAYREDEHRDEEMIWIDGYMIPTGRKRK